MRGTLTSYEEVLPDKGKVLIVDIDSGSYTKSRTGHEIFNLERNTLDNNYYGYAPPAGGVDITRLDPDAKDFVDGVLVVYVKAISETIKYRKIIAFCENARIFREPQSGENLNRQFIDKNGKTEVAEYHIVSDNLTDLRSRTPGFVIELSNYNPYMFRYQRSFLEKYPQLKSDIIKYIYRLNTLDNDGATEQENIQDEHPASDEYSSEYGKKDDDVINTSQGKAIKKLSSIAKKVLNDNEYRCLCDSEHSTFQSGYGKPYMEGHHLIPCTVTNSAMIKQRFGSKLDREENIVCICPTCHRAIHFGSAEVKRDLIKKLYDRQKDKLASVGITLTLEELQWFYNV
jgi:5-methylcytosine-specific restriction protein A